MVSLRLPPGTPPTTVAGSGQAGCSSSPAEAGSSEFDVDSFIDLSVSLSVLSSDRFKNKERRERESAQKDSGW